VGQLTINVTIFEKSVPACLYFVECMKVELLNKRRRVLLLPVRNDSRTPSKFNFGGFEFEKQPHARTHVFTDD